MMYPLTCRAAIAAAGFVLPFALVELPTTAATVLSPSQQGQVSVLQGIRLAQDQTPALTLETLQEASYQIPGQGTISLSNGTYSDPDQQLSVKLSDVLDFGDLNDDGSEDAAVILIINTGGSREDRYLTAVLNAGSQPQQAHSVLLKERQFNVEQVTIEEGLVTVKLREPVPDIPLAPPGRVLVETYRLNATTNRLVGTSLRQENLRDEPYLDLETSGSDSRNGADRDTRRGVELKLPF